ncbi:MAG: hypothetical protein DIU68_007735 [Chloroflexota bacterium]|nr:MAG: hypothetical protein DIU68_14470 [Chloroflexota bacterium]
MPLRLYIASLLLLLVAACQPAVEAPPAPTVIPFPTMTPGRLLRGALPTVEANANAAGLANPATAVALANRPTPTPDYSHCPPPATTSLPPLPDTGRAMAEAITRFLSEGGAPATLESRLRNDWDVLGENGLVRADFDLTGEGASDVIVAYQTPDEGGMLLILSCGDGRYVPRYQYAGGDSAPQIIQIGDMTFDNSPELLFVATTCESGSRCRHNTELVTWSSQLGRFVSLLGSDIVAEVLPTVSDMDNDQIAEIVLQFTNAGNATTGPLRTGMTIYDWNGAAYVQSITQLDPPRFRIQVIHEADRLLNRLNAHDAIPLYRLALDDASLEPWLNDEGPVLESYALYRLLLAHAYLDDGGVLEAYQTILDRFPDTETAPVYAPLATAFWNAFQVTNNLRSACLEVHEFIQTRPEAVDLLNRYGERSPTATPQTICPF